MINGHSNFTTTAQALVIDIPQNERQSLRDDHLFLTWVIFSTVYVYLDLTECQASYLVLCVQYVINECQLREEVVYLYWGL